MSKRYAIQVKGTQLFVVDQAASVNAGYEVAPFDPKRTFVCTTKRSASAVRDMFAFKLGMELEVVPAPERRK